MKQTTLTQGFKRPVNPTDDIEDAATGPKVKTAEIISWTRRGDGPAFFMPYMLERISLGFIDVPNPRYNKVISRISLKPEDVRCMALWSKDYQNFINAWMDPKTGATLQRYDSWLFNFTINGESHSELEPGLRTTLDQRLEQLAWLAKTFSHSAVVLRFDPIVRYMRSAGSQVYDNLQYFEKIVSVAGSLGIYFVTIAFCNPYKRVVDRMTRHGLRLLPPDETGKKIIIAKLLAFCKKIGVFIKVCSQPSVNALDDTLVLGKCIDGDLINVLLAFNGKPLLKHAKCHEVGTAHGEKVAVGSKSSSLGCQCTKSAEIGSYASEFACAYGCVYCYANPMNVTSQQQK
jgi:hypothetical protein